MGGMGGNATRDGLPWQSGEGLSLDPLRQRWTRRRRGAPGSIRPRSAGV